MKLTREVAALPLFLLALQGCERHPEDWTPIQEETSTVFLQTETQRLLEHVERAIENLTADPGAAGEDLLAAESTLEHLLDYYIPLLEARERAYNAYRSLYLGDGARVEEELRLIEELLDFMAEKAERQRLEEVRSLAETLADARMAALASEGEAAAALQELARRLNQAALKGDLILER